MYPALSQADNWINAALAGIQWLEDWSKRRGDVGRRRRSLGRKTDVNKLSVQSNKTGWNEVV